MIKAVIFDIDDTLVDRNATMRLALSEQYERFSRSLSIFNKEEYISQILDFQKYGYVNPTIAYNQFFSDHNENGALVSDLNNDLISRYGLTTILFDGVIELLEDTQQRYTLSIISNGRLDWQMRKLKQSNIDRYFNTVIVSEEVGIKKPDARIFELCVGRIGFQAEQCIYVGDNPDNDILPAMKVGMKTIWKDNGHYDKPKNVNGMFSQMSELSEQIAKIVDLL